VLNRSVYIGAKFRCALPSSCEEVTTVSGTSRPVVAARLLTIFQFRTFVWLFYEQRKLKSFGFFGSFIVRFIYS
jgi:hypothetical protein